VCCGTKRLVEIRCPSECGYLATSREHPSSAVVRRQQQELGLLDECLRDLNERQSQLFLLVSAFLKRYEPSSLHALVDQDVAEASMALASTFETASRGVIYEHRAPSVTADRLATALKPLIAEAGQSGGSAFERDAAVVLRRLEQAVRAVAAIEPSNPRAYLELLARLLQDSGAKPQNAEAIRSPLIAP
jgi:hypothetical protein